MSPVKQCERCANYIITKEVALAIQAECERLKHALNQIAILGSGEHAYTSEFTERVNCIAREALGEHGSK